MALSDLLVPLVAVGAGLVVLWASDQSSRAFNRRWRASYEASARRAARELKSIDHLRDA